jgi:HK97 family phage major capsid protein
MPTNAATLESVKKKIGALGKRDEARANPNDKRFDQVADALEGAMSRGYQPGERLGLAIIAVAQAGQSKAEGALRWLNDTVKDKTMVADIERTMNQVNPKEGGMFVPEAWSDEVVPFLRDKTILLQMAIRIIDNPTGDLSLSRVVAAMRAYWKAPEGGRVKTTGSKLGRLRLRDKALACIVPVSSKLFRNTTNIRQFIRDELDMSFATAIDEAAFFGTGGEDEPLGIFAYPGITTVSLSTFTADSLVAMILAHDTALGTMNNPCWVLSPAVWAKLMNMQYANNGGYVFRDEMTRGTIMGIPFKKSTIIKDASPTAGRLMLADWNEYILAPSRPLELLESREGSYYNDAGNVVSMLAEDEVGVRAIWGGDMGPRLLKSFTVSNNVAIS